MISMNHLASTRRPNVALLRRWQRCSPRRLCHTLNRCHAATEDTFWPEPAAINTLKPQSRWNAVAMAFLGDGVWEMSVRQAMFRATGPVSAYVSRTQAMASATAQASIHDALQASGFFTPDEAELLRWASNSNSIKPPQKSNALDYKKATALEALAAHLYLTDAPRLAQLMEAALKAAEELQPQAGKKA